MTATSPDPTFEALETDLAKALDALDRAGLALEERLRLHERAVGLHDELRKKLSAAEAELERIAEQPPRPEKVDQKPEPYEIVRDRLEQVVEALESGDLTLADVVKKRREAELLAKRCHAILDSATGRIQRMNARSRDGALPQEVRASMQAYAPFPADEGDEDVPF